MKELIKTFFSATPAWVEIRGKFDNTCCFHISPQTEDAGKNGRLKLKIFQHGAAETISNVNISLESTSGNITIFIGASNANVSFHNNTSGAFDLRLWRDASITIGKNTTSNGVRIVSDMSVVEVGEDCMFSDDILIQSADQHGIVDLNTGQIVNNKMREVRIGDHVWVGRLSTLMPDIAIGNGSIIGAGAIVTTDVPETCVAVGVPAKVVKTQTTWSRSPVALDAMARKLVG